MFRFMVLMLTDLEADFINPYDASSRINYFIVPEFIGQGLLYMKQQHLIDVTEVFRALNSEKKFRLAKLAYYLTIIIITVFRLVLMLVYYLDSEDE
ncbi:Protein cornichon-like protein [Vigna angularis]|uniref:Protein cornichon-like protein n=1 Tax=Phaseolus angularis TaxID=3914 RepID=A0A8T0L3Z3_PHAAN|nr:Protein cornichon-like protein [Vigna angularis]